MVAPPELLNNKQTTAGLPESKLMLMGETKSKQLSASTLLDQVLEIE
jgi:hypothetical protein